MRSERRLDGSLLATEATDSRFDNPGVLAAVQEFLAALESGSAPDKQEFVARHPEIATELQECLDALEFVHEATPELQRQVEAEVPEHADAPKLLGDYHLLREIGRGGMGVVYEAVQISLNRRVAIKMLPFAAALDRTHLQRFRHEAQAAAQLHHTSIVPVYAVGVERGVHFYAMQLIEGEPLSQLIVCLRRLAGKQTAQETERRAAAGDCLTQTMDGAGRDATRDFPESTATASDPSSSSARLIARDCSKSGRFRLPAELMRQAALALEHAHQFGVVHRDVKPANLLVNEQGNVWITDFGLAHIQADVTLTRTGDVLGTVRYMSPEQAAGDRLVLDHRTDVYSLGATFYELLTLEPVFAESDRHVLLRRIIEEEPRSPRSIDPRIPLELETIVLKAMAKAPQGRYATAKQFADDLERWLDDKPVMARRPSVKEQAVKWCRRHRSLVKMAAVFLGLAFMGLAASTIIIATEQSKTKDAYRNEMNQRLAADESFRQARQAVDAFTELGEQELAGDPALQPLRRKFLETSLEYYQNFLKQRRDDPLMQAELSASSQRVERLIDDLAVVEGFAALPLLAFRPVQDELAIPAEQRRQIEEYLSQLAKERAESRNGQRALDPASRQHQLADVIRSHHHKIAVLINAQQMLRLKQIFWQQLGPFAFTNSEVVAALHLTVDQRTQIRQIIDEENPGRKGGHGPGPDGPHGPGPERRGPPGPDASDHGPFDRPPPPPNDREDGPRGPSPRHRGPPPDDRNDGPPGPPPRHPPPEHGGAGRGPEGDHFHGDQLNRTVERILAVLSDEQRQTWRQLIGEPFIP